MAGPQRPASLPEDVIALLDAGDMSGAARRLLASHPGMDKADAMHAILHYRMGRHNSVYLKHLIHTEETLEKRRAPRRRLPHALVNLGVALSFLWLLIHVFALAASLTVLANIDGYREAAFRVIRADVSTDGGAGDSWWLVGTVGGQERRLAAPDLLPPGEANPARFMASHHPPGSTMPVLYNPDVGDIPFQGRTLGLMPWTADPAATELGRIVAWLLTCLLPFTVFASASWLMRRTATTTVRRPA